MVLMIEVWPCTSGRVGMSFPRVENDALPVGAGWCENAIQQSEETPGMRAYDEEERTDRQGHATVEMPGPSQALRRRRRDERAGCSSTASRCARAIRTRSDGMGFHGSRRTRGGSDGRIGHCDNSLSMEGESRDSCHLNRSESRPRLSISPAPSANTVRSAFVFHVFPGPVRPDRTGEAVVLRNQARHP